MSFRLLSLPIVALLLLIWAPSTASAQSAWCARSQGAESCGFATLSQCRATISGAGGNCFPNPRGPGLGSGLPPLAAAARRARAEQARNWRQTLQERRRAKQRERRELARERPRSVPPPSAPGAVAAMPAGGVPVSELDVNAVPNLTHEGIRRVQMVLKEKGFDPGPPNGVANPRLQAAVRMFQNHYGINARGEIDNQTLLALGEASLASQSNR